MLSLKRSETALSYPLARLSTLTVAYKQAGYSSSVQSSLVSQYSCAATVDSNMNATIALVNFIVSGLVILV